MPRRRPTYTDPLDRLRNTAEGLGLPVNAGRYRYGMLAGRDSGGQASVIADGSADTPGQDGAGQLLVLSATGDSIASGGDYVTFDSQVYRHGFTEGVSADGTTITWPVSASGSIQVEWEWDSYTGGGTVEIEVDGQIPDWGTVVAGSSGQTFVKRRGVHIREGAEVKLKVTQTSGAAKTADVHVEFQVEDPTEFVPARYSVAVLSDEPVAYWRLDESSGTTAADATGNGHDGTYIGTHSLGADGVMQDGYDHAALELAAASSSGMQGSDWADLEFVGTASFSVECWFNADSLTSGSKILVQKASSGNASGWELIVNGTDDWVAFTRQATGGNVHSAAGSVTTGTDHHAVATYDGATLRLYLDGVLVDSVATTVAVSSSAVDLSIGYDSVDTTFGFDGRIDEAAVYDFALSAARIANHYSVGRQAA